MFVSNFMILNAVVENHSLHDSDVLTAEPWEVDASELDCGCLEDVEGAYVLRYL